MFWPTDYLNCLVSKYLTPLCVFSIADVCNSTVVRALSLHDSSFFQLIKLVLWMQI